MSTEASHGICSNCGARLARGAESCRYCDAPTSDEDLGRAPSVNRSVHEAADAWAKDLFGAPRNFSRLITAVQVRDQVLERVVTEVVRRDIHEERIAAPMRGRSSTNIDPRTIDPFAITVEQLRSDSEHTTPCAYCGGSGRGACNHCSGSGRMRCRTCSGSGHVTKYNKKSTRQIRCTVCGASGTVDCSGCGGSGNVTCGGCAGGGLQLAWLTYNQTHRWHVTVERKNPIVIAHRQLAEERMLTSPELDAFSVLIKVEADGPVALEGFRGEDGAIVQAAISTLDTHHERVNRQQYLKLAVVRRDATYSMCGTTGTLVLSGKDLSGAHTQEALRPISRRSTMWGASLVAVAVATGIELASLGGTGPYFHRSNSLTTAAWVLGIVLSVPALGAALRGWRSGFRFAGVTPVEKGMAIGTAVAFALMLIIGYASRPRVGEVATALAAGDVARARMTVDALKEIHTPAAVVQQADDDVMFAEAKLVTGDARLDLLDHVAADKGSNAAAATAASRAERIARIHSALDAKDPVAAGQLIDRWFSASWKADPELAELRSSAYDLAVSKCSDNACRFIASVAADTAAVTPKRDAQVASSKQDLLSALTIADVSNETMLARAQRLRAISTLAKAASAASDSEVGAKAKASGDLADAGRAKMAIIGVDPPVAEELFGTSGTTTNAIDAMTVDGESVFLSLDAQKKCKGVYAVGLSKGARSLSGATWTGDRILSQSVGHSASVKKPPTDTATSAQWYEGGTPVTARWESGALVELRIGDATP